MSRWVERDKMRFHGGLCGGNRVNYSGGGIWAWMAGVRSKRANDSATAAGDEETLWWMLSWAAEIEIKQIYAIDVMLQVAIFITIQPKLLDLAWERRKFELEGGTLSRVMP